MKINAKGNDRLVETRNKPKDKEVNVLASSQHYQRTILVHTNNLHIEVSQ